MKKIIIFVVSLLLLSCADSKVKELEDRNKHLERRITELEKIKEQLVSTNDGLKATIVEMREDMKKIQHHAQMAATHSESAAFWNRVGNDFLEESSMRNMSSDFNDISNIANSNVNDIY